MIRKFIFSSILIILFSISGVAFADTLGEQRQFFIDSTYDFFSRNKATATLKEESGNAYFYVSDDYFNSLGSRQTEFNNLLEQLADEFDSRIYPILTSFWGEIPNPGIDNDPKITILFTRLINEAGGYFDTSNQYSITRVPSSNERELIYINAESLFTDRAKIFMAHEFQHLITFNQKDILRKAVDDIWLNEVRSEYTSTLLNYDSVFEDSNLRRRTLSYLAEPSDPLAEWKNKNSDYGVVTLFGHYLADSYGEEILKDSLNSYLVGISSIDEALRSNGFAKTFSDIFSDWTVTSFLNNPTADELSYKNLHLSSLKVNPTQRYGSPFASNLLVNISKTVKDWEPNWYEFSLGSGNLKIEFSSSIGSRFRVPYIIFRNDGSGEVKELSMANNRGVDFVENLGAEISKVVVIPSNQSKFSDFSASDPVATFSLKVSSVASVDEALITVSVPTPSVPSLSDGALIRVSDSNTFYVIKGNWIRNIPSAEVLNFYGHLSAERAINAGPEIFESHKVSNYVKEVNDDKIYAIWPDNTKHWMNMSGRQFKESGRSFDAVYVINKAELDFYSTGAEIRD